MTSAQDIFQIIEQTEVPLNPFEQIEIIDNPLNPFKSVDEEESDS